MTHLLTFSLCCAGFMALALTAGRQQRDLFARPLTAANVAFVRAAACLVLAVALALLVSSQGWSLGLVMFSGHTSVAAGVVHTALIAWSRSAVAQPAED